MVEVAGREVKVSNPAKVFFSARGETKLDLVEYYLAVGEGVLRGVHLRPTVMKRYPDGAEGKMFFQHRVPASHPDWLQTVTVAYPNAGTAVLLCPVDLAHVVWAVNLGCLDLNPWASRRFDLEHPDELRIDLDPQPGVTFAEVKQVAACVRDVLDECGMVSFPKTSGSRGIHIYVRLVARWTFADLFRAGVALAVEVRRRLPALVTLEWAKDDRGRTVYIDIGQNARDRTVASAYSVRANPAAMVSAPFAWEELDDIELADFTLATMPARYRERGDVHGAIDEAPQSLAALLDLADRAPS